MLIKKIGVTMASLYHPSLFHKCELVRSRLHDTISGVLSDKLIKLERENKYLVTSYK